MIISTQKGVIKVLGVDLTKQIYYLHGVDESGNTVLKKKLSRSELITFVANLPPCLIGLEASGGAHHWVRVFKRFGHRVRMMTPQFIKPYGDSNKHDTVDAEAICKAAQGSNVRIFPEKSIYQQVLQSMHRIRSKLVTHRTV